MILSFPKEPSLLVFPPYNTKVSLKHNKFIYILVCREKQPHKKDRIFFLKIDNHKNKSWTFFSENRKLFCPGTSQDRGVCPGTTTSALVPGQRDSGTRKMSLSRDKGTAGRPVPVCPGTSRGTSRPVKTLV